MYEDFFGLRESAFGISPNPRYLVLTPRIEEATEELFYGIQTHKGLMLLTGAPGTGKTTLLNGLRARLHGKKTPVAFIDGSHLDVSCLYELVLTGFKVKRAAPAGLHPLLLMKQWAGECDRLGKNPVLIVDEAQTLRLDVLEEIRMLLNLETPDEKKLQIVLSGNEELEEALRQPRLCGLKQRVAVRCKTAPLSIEETYQYVYERLRIAGSTGEREIFSPEAIEAIHCCSGGIPRVINILCEHALVLAYVDGIQPIPAHVVASLAREHQCDPIRTFPPTQDREPQRTSNVAGPSRALELADRSGDAAEVRCPRIVKSPSRASTEAGIVPRQLSPTVRASGRSEARTEGESVGAGIPAAPVAPNQIASSSSPGPAFDSLTRVLRQPIELVRPAVGSKASVGIVQRSWPGILASSSRWLRQAIYSAEVSRRCRLALHRGWTGTIIALLRWLHEPFNPIAWLPHLFDAGRPPRPREP